MVRAMSYRCHLLGRNSFAVSPCGLWVTTPEDEANSRVFCASPFALGCIRANAMHHAAGTAVQ
jgi:hypothetical protein